MKSKLVLLILGMAVQPPAGAQPDPQAPTFLDAMHEQLGLKLEPARGSYPVLVIDHVEKPSEN